MVQPSSKLHPEPLTHNSRIHNDVSMGQLVTLKAGVIHRTLQTLYA